MKMILSLTILIFVTTSQATMMSHFNKKLECRDINDNLIHAKMDLEKLTALTEMSKKHKDYLEEAQEYVMQYCKPDSGSFLAKKTSVLDMGLPEKIGAIELKIDQMNYHTKDENDLKAISKNILRNYSSFAENQKFSSMSKSEDCTKTTETGNTKIEEYKTAGEKFMNLQMGLINRIYSMEEFQAQCENKFM